MIDSDPEFMSLIADKVADKIADRVAEIVAKNHQDMFDPLVSVKDICKYLNCSRSYFDSHYFTQEGFPYHTKGREYCFRISEVSQWLHEHTLTA